MLLAAHLQHYRSRAHGEAALSELGGQLSLKSINHLRELLRGAARKCALAQQHLSDRVGNYVESMIKAGAMAPLALIHRVSYDETPLRLATTNEQEHSSTTGLCKLFVVHSSWCSLMRDTLDKKIVSIHASWSPILRTASSTSGECVAGVLSSAPRPPQALVPMFRGKCIRSIETDQAPGNIRGERLLQGSPMGRPWTLLHHFCAAHKVHAMSDRTWMLAKPCLKGVLRTLLFFSTASQFAKLIGTLKAEIPHLLRVVTGDLTDEAKVYRRSILTTYLPRQPVRKSFLVAVSSDLLNGDWRVANVIVHRCGPSCCRSRTHTIEKLQHYLPKLMQTLKPSSLCKGNWTDWSKPLPFIGFWLGAHGLLSLLFQKAFASTAVPVILNQRSVGPENPLRNDSLHFLPLPFSNRSLIALSSFRSSTETSGALVGSQRLPTKRGSATKTPPNKPTTLLFQSSTAMPCPDATQNTG